MSLLTELYEAYQLSEEAGLVDSHKENNTVLLPIYHNNMKSNGKNIIRIHLNADSTIDSAQFVPSDEYIIFPVNESSVTRAGSTSAPHPLVDNLNYIAPNNSDNHRTFRALFSNWYEFLDDSHDTKQFLTVIKHFIFSQDMLSQIVDHLLEHTPYVLKDLEVQWTEINGDRRLQKTLDLSKLFLTYSINEFDGLRNMDTTKYVNLHQSYIDYVNTHLVPNGFCGVSGEYTYTSSKHRGLQGNAKLVSVSNNTETYLGRFVNKMDVFTIGYQTSEKIHLMLKYLLTNKNSSTWLGEQQYLINWFSTDISNESSFSINNSSLYNLFENVSQEQNQMHYQAVSQRSKEVGRSIYTGHLSIDKDSNYYVAIVDKSSNGRLSLKYFRKMQASQLTRNLEKWQLLNHWEYYHFDMQSYGVRVPSMNEIIMNTFGVERDGKLVFDNGNYKKDLTQKLVSCLIDGSPIPRNFVNHMDINIRKRLSYSTKWNSIVGVACSILNNEREGTFNPMVDKLNLDRSYLFGRLLAIYELIESRTFDKDTTRVTNASKYWSSFTNNPENIMQTLEEKIKPYEKKLRISHPGLFFKIQKEKEEIITHLDKHTSAQDANKRLGYQFIFGYYSERKFIFTSQKEES